MIKTRKCTKCGETKESDQFYWRCKLKGYKQSLCKVCDVAKNREHPERTRASVKRWSKKNPEKRRSIERRRRALKWQLKENFGAEQAAFVKRRFKNKCFRCSSVENLCLDHHRPLSAGNPLTMDNCVILCTRCNSKKWMHLPESFYTKKELAKVNFTLKLNDTAWKLKQWVKLNPDQTKEI